MLSMNQRAVLALASFLLVAIMAGTALRVRYAVASHHYQVAERVQGRDQVKHLERALDLDPGLVKARMQLAEDLMDLGQYQRALTQLDLLVHQHNQANVDAWELRERHGEVLYHLGRIPEAIASLRAADAIRSQQPQTHVFLARALLAGKQRDAAEQEYRQVIARDPHAAGRQSPGAEVAYQELARLLFAAAQDQAASDLGRAMMAASPQLGMDWHEVLADRSLAQGQPQATLEQLRLAAAADPQSTSPHLAAADILQRLGQDSAAVKECETAVALAPGDPAAQLSLAAALEADKQWDRAVDSYRAVEKVRPDAFAEWVAQARGPQENNPAVVLWQEHLELVVNPGDVRLMGPDSEPGIQQAWYAGDSGEHHVDVPIANTLYLQGALAQVRHDYTSAGQFYENALHFIPPAESSHNTDFTNRLRDAVEASIDAVLQSQLSGRPASR